MCVMLLLKWSGGSEVEDAWFLALSIVPNGITAGLPASLLCFVFDDTFFSSLSLSHFSITYCFAAMWLSDLMCAFAVRRYALAVIHDDMDVEADLHVLSCATCPASQTSCFRIHGGGTYKASSCKSPS